MTTIEYRLKVDLLTPFEQNHQMDQRHLPRDKTQPGGALRGDRGVPDFKGSDKGMSASCGPNAQPLTLSTMRCTSLVIITARQA